MSELLSQSTQEKKENTFLIFCTFLVIYLTNSIMYLVLTFTGDIVIILC